MQTITLHLEDGTDFVIQDKPDSNAAGSESGEILAFTGITVSFEDGARIGYGSHKLSSNTIVMDETTNAPVAPEAPVEAPTEEVVTPKVPVEEVPAEVEVAATE